jgi:hypothetical protein
MEALAKPDIEINEDYDFWNAVRNLKAPYVKFCNAYNSRISLRLLSIVSSAKMKVKQPLRLLRALFLAGKVGLLWQSKRRAK